VRSFLLLLVLPAAAGRDALEDQSLAAASAHNPGPRHSLEPDAEAALQTAPPDAVPVHIGSVHHPSAAPGIRFQAHHETARP
jgi:hypothetical protein